MDCITFENARLLTASGVLFPATVVVREGRIVYAGSSPLAPPPCKIRHDIQKGIIAPGLIDIHTHGGHGVAFGKLATLAEDLHTYSAWVVSTGVTGFLCSIAAPDHDTLLALVQAYADVFEAGGFTGAMPLGLHLEGPYLNPEKKGAFNAAWLRRPCCDEVRALLDAGRGWVRQMTLAPELPGATDVAALLRDAGVVVALGHSNTDYTTASAALQGDFGHVTHTFNAQRGLHHRKPGVLGAVLASDGVTAELIADTVHVHPAAMKVLLRCLGPERVVLVTDAMAAAGLGDGHYHLTGHEVVVKNGVARNSTGAIAGSTAALDACVRNVHRRLGLSLADAVRMASVNPARVLGIEAGLAAGQPANWIVLDEQAHIMYTVMRGHTVYNR